MHLCVDTKFYTVTLEPSIQQFVSLMAELSPQQESLLSPPPVFNGSSNALLSSVTNDGQELLLYCGHMCGGSSPPVPSLALSHHSLFTRRVCASSGCRRVLWSAHNNSYTVCTVCCDGFCDINNRYFEYALSRRGESVRKAPISSGNLSFLAPMGLLSFLSHQDQTGNQCIVW